MSLRQKKLPIEILERIDDQCAKFEQAWQSDASPVIEAFLNPDFTADQREVLLAELIVLDIDYRVRRGEKPTREAYLEKFPENGTAVEVAFKEGFHRNATFQAPTLTQISNLFPSLEILELLGAGGMGAVYKARQKGLDRIVALKILPEEFGHDIRFALRFTREARTLAKLTHPNIVSVFEFGKVEETYYFLMEFVEGSTLRAVIQAGELNPKHALAIVPHLCDALQYAHDNGVIHRDIKPENILLARDGTVKIADFGLSRLMGSDSTNDSLTGTHQIMGTPRYMAPESLEGSHHVDHRADIYSLGVVFYEMLTGELPMGRFAVPSQKVNVDIRLDEVVLRTLEKEPDRRYQHASQVKSDVELIATSPNSDGQTTDVYSPSTSHRTTRSQLDLADQELAGRFLLTRRQLMERVEHSLRPLFRGQMFQAFVGAAIIILGVQCWARNTGVLSKVICGGILHAYGILVIAQAMLVVTRIRDIDYSKPVSEIRKRLNRLQFSYLQAGIIIGFVWWLMWLPVTVAIGFDDVLHPYSLIPSLAVGIPGFLVSVWIYLRVLRSSADSAKDWRRKLSGESIASAFLALEEIEEAKID